MSDPQIPHPLATEPAPSPALESAFAAISARARHRPEGPEPADQPPARAVHSDIA